jgi:hypothetical protein
VAIEGRCALACEATVELEEREIANPLIDRVLAGIPAYRHRKGRKTSEDFRYFVGCPTTLSPSVISNLLKLFILGGRESGGERGIRTLDRAFQPYNGLANRRLQPLGHLSGAIVVSI